MKLSGNLYGKSRVWERISRNDKITKGKGIINYYKWDTNYILMKIWIPYKLKCGFNAVQEKAIKYVYGSLK